MDKSGDWVDTYLSIGGRTTVVRLPRSAITSVDEHNQRCRELGALEFQVLAQREPLIKRFGRWTVELRT